jgi:hypothetical protein
MNVYRNQYDMLYILCSTVPQFEAKMDELRKFNVEAYNWLVSIPAQHWARSHFTGTNRSRSLYLKLVFCMNIKSDLLRNAISYI